MECSFCFADSTEVTAMVGGPDMVAICEDCVNKCVKIFDEVYRQRTPTDVYAAAFNELYGTD